LHLALSLKLASAAPSKAPAEVIPRTEMSHPCSRSLSRTVRKQLEREILKPAQKAGVDVWPRGCPLDPARDLWGKHEKQKSRKRSSGTQWSCGICGKSFKSEHYIDLHMERKHMNETPRGGVCIADYCEWFDTCQGETRLKKKKGEPACDNKTMAQARSSCEEAMIKCFPLDQPESRKLNAKFTKELCRVLDCRIREEQKKEHHMDMMPVVVLMILIILVCFMFFSLMVCCVDYSDDILQALVESGLASTSLVKKLTKARNEVRKPLGYDRTKSI